MKIEKTINNERNGFQIIDDDSEYFIEADSEELALLKYEEIKYREMNPLPPSYKVLRAKEYPPIEEQLDLIYWDKINGTNNWEKAISAVKERYPKQ
ncbi:MAG TPA: hypothetical protein PLT92_14820 [Ignavibacteriaceae bacterium]|nr:hypothetical protein [Ignavibacteriaceae bacterium]